MWSVSYDDYDADHDDDDGDGDDDDGNDDDAHDDDGGGKSVTCGASVRRQGAGCPSSSAHIQGYYYYPCNHHHEYSRIIFFSS